MLSPEELNQLNQIPILKDILDLFSHQEKEITLLKRELTKINKVLDSEFSQSLEKAIKERIDKIIHSLENKPSFQSSN